jgi:glutamate dehydrogenase
MKRGDLDQAKADLIEAAADLAAERSHAGDPDLARLLVEAYYRLVAPSDVIEREPIDLYGAAMNHWRLGQARVPGQAVVRVGTPTIGADGWHCGHTIIDIVTDDMPFIVDSVSMEVERLGYEVNLLVHPLVLVTRDDSNEQILSIVNRTDAAGQPGLAESWLHLEIEPISGEERRRLEVELYRVLSDVRATVDDWDPMLESVAALASELDQGVPGIGAIELADAVALLRWLPDYFTFIGYREYDLLDDPEGGPGTLRTRPDTGLGVLRQTEATATDLATVAPEVAARARDRRLLNLTTTNAVSTVHRSSPLDYVGVKRMDADGEPIGECRIVGLLNARAHAVSVEEIPVVATKVADVMEQSGFSPGSHDHNSLLAIIEGYPRDELFQISVDDLSRIALGILHLRDRREVKVFVRRDDFGRFYSCLVYVPRERHNTEVRLKIQEALLQAFGGDRATWSIEMGSSSLARLHVVVYTEPGNVADVDLDVLEQRITRLTRRWSDELERALTGELGDSVGAHLLHSYRAAFPAAYRDETLPETAVADVVCLDDLGEGELMVRLYRPLRGVGDGTRLKVYWSGEPISLSRVVPLLHDLGATVVDERPYEVEPADSGRRWIYDFGLLLPLVGDDLDRSLRERFEEAFVAAFEGRAESDGFAQLVVTAGMTWREVMLFRAYAKYTRQIGSRWSQRYLEDTLTRQGEIAARIIELFHLRFDPERRQDVAADELSALLLDLIEGVESLEEDQILRGFIELINATDRTNFYQRDPAGDPRASLALKLNPSRVEAMPRPSPDREIFVYSPFVEGVHLRAGAVARGGIRWSDRREDFRTEILGLMKAQTVKNAVIVPVGAKGGFVCKRLPLPDREATMREVEGCYDVFIGALLDLTDNLSDGDVVSAPDTVRRDADDVYLVVAADKGTAQFSDRANSIAQGRGFWLGDAFASGGSVGYDHKKMGITARGAWESAKRHFRDLAIDIQAEPITVVGIGDMSGDVFGNGLLASESLKLVAAFDHRHVFIDPSPDPAASYAERKRLFELQRSSWADYDEESISTGGGVFSRSAKSVELSDEIRELLEFAEPECTPSELISAILRAHVDLIWNGGIGTYVKSESETDVQVGDKANDEVRIDASELRCSVVVEGGNLGLTQRARIDFAIDGGLINTDAIDNSAGVDCSDHEVNIKILLDRLVVAGDLTEKQRDELLVGMTDEVARLVIADNYAQTQILSMSREQAPGMVDVHMRHLDWLESVAGLDREVECLPSDQQLVTRQVEGRGLTQPELAVMMAYTKRLLAEAVLLSDLPEEHAYDDLLLGYFPVPISERFATAIDSHPLRRELSATVITNRLVNRAGISMVHRLEEETSASISDIARAHAAAWRMYHLEERWEQVESLDGQIDPQLQLGMLLDIKRLAERATRWVVRYQPAPLRIDAVVATFEAPVREFLTLVPEVLAGPDHGEYMANFKRMSEAGVPEAVARDLASLSLAVVALDLADIATGSGRSVEDVAQLYFELDSELGLSWLRAEIIGLPRDDKWSSLARSALRDDFFRAHADLTRRLASVDSGVDAEGLVRRWSDHNSAPFGRLRNALVEVHRSDADDLARVSVALRELRNLSDQMQSPQH